MNNDDLRVSAIDAAATCAREDTEQGASQLVSVEPQRRPYRDVPRDFIERWPQVGWGDAKDEFRAHARTISRWLDECGRDDMILARKRYLDAQRAVASRVRRKRYVLGRTLTDRAGQ